VGASGWSHRVAHRDDVQAALDELRADVFARGDYTKQWELLPALLGDLADEVASYGGDAESVARLRRGEPPRTIEEALGWSTTEGTHSVLDTPTVGDTPGFGVITPADPSLLIDLFGTDRPDAAAVWAARDELDESIDDRWAGIYVVGYEGGKPSTIVFVGVSGD